MKVLRAEVHPATGPPGRLLGIQDPALVVGTGSGALALLAVQAEGKRRVTGAEFARGQRLHVGGRLA